MSEKQSKKFEHFETPSSTLDHEIVSSSHETTETAKKLDEQKEQLSEARELVSKQSAEKDQLIDKLKAEQGPKDEDESKRPVGVQAKKQTFKTEIGHVRRKLGKADRLGSKVIHQPVVRAVSEVSSRTVARPSGLLGGGIVAFLGTLTYLYLTKHIGLKYNYSIFLFLLVVGFAVGLVLEVIIRLARGRRSI